MYQKVIIIGNLGGDPVMRYTSGGDAVTSFSVATSRHWNDSSGQRQEKTVWFKVSAWRKLGEICNQYLSKGRQVMVEGEMQESKPFQGRDGEWRSSLEVTARNVQFLGSKSDSQQPPKSDVSAGNSASTNGTFPVDVDEIPF